MLIKTIVRGGLHWGIQTGGTLRLVLALSSVIFMPAGFVLVGNNNTDDGNDNVLVFVFNRWTCATMVQK